MPRWAKVILWIVVFGASAGAGAYVAAHTDPFPPGVDDPGARAEPTSTSPGASAPSAATQRWRLTLRSDSAHVFRVGGSCRTSWRASFVVRIGADGRVEGEGEATLAQPRACDFPVAQVQTEAATLSVTGRSADGATRLRFDVDERAPPASKDAGGFLAIMGSATFRVRDGDAARVELQAADGVGGTFRATTSIELRCVSGCVD
jgi:hypothetical protein